MFSADSPQSFLEHEDQLHGSYWILWGLRFGALGGFWVEGVGFQVRCCKNDLSESCMKSSL